MIVPDTYKYNSVDIAKAIVAYANENKFVINMTKIQKLLFIVYGVFLAVKTERLIDEHPQAWPYGPVFPTTRNKLLKLEFSNISWEEPSLQTIHEDKEVLSLLGLVFRTYGANNAASLVEWTHQSGSPWTLTTKMPNFQWGDRIPDEFIYNYFNSIIVRNAG